MILHSIEVEGWRCFAERVVLGPLSERINVLFGPNGTGKSTLLRALASGLLDNHAASGEPAESLRPWNREVSPRVAIEFTHEGRRYRIAKQFLASPHSELARQEDGRFVRLAEGRAADAQVRQMLGADPPVRGLVEPKDWGLGQVLWARQDGLPVPELKGSVQSQIRASLGAQLRDPRGEAFFERITAAYLKIFTPGGSLKRGRDAPPLKRLEDELAEKQGRQTELQLQLDALERESAEVQRLAGCRDALAEKEKEQATALDELVRRAADYDRLENRCQVQKATADAAKSKHDERAGQVKRIRELRKLLREDHQALAQLEADAPARLAEFRRSSEELAQADHRIKELRARRDALAQQARVVQEATELAEQRKLLEDLDRVLTRAEEASRDRDAHAGRLAELAAPTPQRLREIQTAHARAERLRQKLDAAGVRLEIVPERDGEIHVSAGQPPGVHPLRPGETLVLRGDPALEFTLPGVGAFRAIGAIDTPVETLREELADALAELDRLADGLPTRDVGALEELRAKADPVERDRNDAQSKLEAILEGRELDALRQDRDEAARAVDALLGVHPDWADAPPDAKRLEDELVKAREALDADQENAKGARDQAVKAQYEAREVQNTHAQQEKTLRDRIATTQRDLDALTGEADDATREAKLNELALQWRAAQADLDEAEAALGQYEPDLHEQVESLRNQLKETHDQQAAVAEELAQARGRLETLVAAAPRSALNVVEERIAELESQIAAERLRGDAIRLLFETVRRCRDEAVASVIGPVQDRATGTLARIAGRPMGDVALDGSMAVCGLSTPRTDLSVELEELSGGEREQVHLAVRLALAEVLAGDQRHLLVLDDVLTATDPARLARIREILAEMAERFQILVLTCHGDRYRELPDAALFDLQELTRTV